MLTFFKKTVVLLCAAAFLPLCACGVNPHEPDVPPVPAPSKPILPDPLPEPSTEQPSFPENPYWDTSNVDISKIDKTKKLLSFTFDDAPAKTLESLVGAFAYYNAQNPDCPASATLFCNGAYIQEYNLPALQTAHVLSFELGNHTYAHKDLTTLSDEELLFEVTKTDEILKTIDGNEAHLLRAPYGRIDERLKAIAQAPIFDWYVDTLDWTGRSADEIYESVFSAKGEGVIVLMHDGYENTVEAVKRLLPDLKEAGYQVVSISQMAKAHKLPLKKGGVYTRARPPKQANK